jgi:hypothetical protein
MRSARRHLQAQSVAPPSCRRFSLRATPPHSVNHPTLKRCHPERSEGSQTEAAPQIVRHHAFFDAA